MHSLSRHHCRAGKHYVVVSSCLIIVQNASNDQCMETYSDEYDAFFVVSGTVRASAVQQRMENVKIS